MTPNLVKYHGDFYEVLGKIGDELTIKVSTSIDMVKLPAPPTELVTYKVGEEVRLKKSIRPECRVFIRGELDWGSVGFTHHIEIITPYGEPNLVAYSQSIHNIMKLKR